jgi:hypothetical protein
MNRRRTRLFISIFVHSIKIQEEIPDKIEGTIDRAYYKRKRDHNLSCTEKGGCHYGFCNAKFCHCCGETWKK